MHTKDILAQALTEAGLPQMAARAASGHYHDFLSPLTFPELELDGELRAAGTPAAEAVRQHLPEGIFDASIEESDDWAESQDGQDTMRKLIGTNEKIRGG